jgi:hypothetical protein
MRTGTRVRKGIYRQCENEKCKASFYVPPGQPDLKCCSLECRSARKAQERANGGWEVRAARKMRRDAVGLRKANFDDSALVACLMPKPPPVVPGMVTIRRTFPDD